MDEKTYLTKYLNNKVYFMKDNRLLDQKAQPVMMGWEDPIMKEF